MFEMVNGTPSKAVGGVVRTYYTLFGIDQQIKGLTPKAVNGTKGRWTDRWFSLLLILGFEFF